MTLTEFGPLVVGEDAIQSRHQELGERRFAEGISLSEVLWATHTDKAAAD
jgi:hypothetical protein